MLKTLGFVQSVKDTENIKVIGFEEGIYLAGIICGFDL